VEPTACLAAAVIAKTLEFALTKPGMLKLGETVPGQVGGKPKAKILNGHANGHANGSANGSGNGHVNGSHSNGYPSCVMQESHWCPPAFADAVELATTMRGLRWKFGQGVYIPKYTRPLDRPGFLRATALSFVKNLLLVDLFESTLKLFPGIGSPTGGTMFYPSLSPIPRYTVSTIIHIMSGTCLLSGFNMVYDLITLIAVGVLGGSPLSWPPIMGKPFLSDSMHTFWAREWHQLLRETFLVFGGYPGKWIAGDIGMLFGTFLASGLFHECGLYNMSGGFEYTAVAFFGSQGFVLLGERYWRRVTGRRVGGWPGRLWVYFIMFVAAQPMVDAWLRRGLGGGMVIPPQISPARVFLLPLAKSIVSKF